MGNIQKEFFGTLDSGENVEKYTLVGNEGLSATILTYGATVQSLCFNGIDVVLGYDTLEGYVNGNSYQGASVGRYGNRIENGRFSIGEKLYDLSKNEKGLTTLHGGNSGFSSKIWNAEIIESNIPTLRLMLTSEDGEEGFPGKLTAYVTYCIDNDNSLRIIYEALCDKDTHYNPTCHAYFNLNGTGESVLNVKMQLNADEYTPVDNLLIPLKENMRVDKTAFDFKTIKEIGRDIENNDPQLAIVGQGYDHNFILNGKQPFATLISEKTKICMECYTDQPGVQVYSATCLDERCGKGGKPLSRFQGICLETQHFPNSPNRPDFPSTLLHANKPYHSETVYRFSKIK